MERKLGGSCAQSTDDPVAAPLRHGRDPETGAERHTSRFPLLDISAILAPYQLNKYQNYWPLSAQFRALNKEQPLNLNRLFVTLEPS